MLTEEIVMQGIEDLKGKAGMAEAQEEAGVSPAELTDEQRAAGAMEPEFVSLVNSKLLDNKELMNTIQGAAIAALVNSAALLVLIELGYHIRKLQEKAEQQGQAQQSEPQPDQTQQPVAVGQ